MNQETGENEAANTFLNTAQEFSQEEAIQKIKEISKERKFTESIDAIIKLNVDPTKGD